MFLTNLVAGDAKAPEHRAHSKTWRRREARCERRSVLDCVRCRAAFGRALTTFAEDEW